MTNREWLLNKMQNMSDEELAEILACESRMCEMMNKECVGGDCTYCILPWLKSEHKEKITLSEAERTILENIDKEYKWIARDENGRLHVFINKPEKYTNFWNSNSLIGINVFRHLFQFITWNDEEPYNIEKLLKGK